MTGAPVMTDVLLASPPVSAPPSDSTGAGLDGAAGSTDGTNANAAVGGATDANTSSQGTSPSFTDALAAAATQQSASSGSAQDAAPAAKTSASSDAQDSSSTDPADGDAATLNGALSTSTSTKTRGSRSGSGSDGSGGRAIARGRHRGVSDGRGGATQSALSSAQAASSDLPATIVGAADSTAASATTAGQAKTSTDAAGGGGIGAAAAPADGRALASPLRSAGDVPADSAVESQAVDDPAIGGPASSGQPAHAPTPGSSGTAEDPSPAPAVSTTVSSATPSGARSSTTATATAALAGVTPSTTSDPTTGSGNEGQGRGADQGTGDGLAGTGASGAQNSQDGSRTAAASNQKPDVLSSSTPAPAATTRLASADATGPAPLAAMSNPNASIGSVGAAAAAEATAAADSSEASVPDQMLTVLNPLRTSDDGSQFVTLALQPEGLGNVQATVTIVGQQISVNLWADSATGHAALSQTMSQLHSQLSDGTDRHVTVDLADFGSAQPDARQGQTPGAPGTPGHEGTTAHDYALDEDQATAPLPLMGGRRVDLQL